MDLDQEEAQKKLTQNHLCLNFWDGVLLLFTLLHLHYLQEVIFSAHQLQGKCFEHCIVLYPVLVNLTKASMGFYQTP